MAGSLDVTKTAHVLRLDHAHLKRRLAAAGAGHTAPETQQSLPGSLFKLVSSSAAPAAECLSKLEAPGNTKLKADLKGKELADIGVLARSLAKSLT